MGTEQKRPHWGGGLKVEREGGIKLNILKNKFCSQLDNDTKLFQQSFSMMD